MNRLCFLKKFELFVLLTIGVSSATSFCKPAWPEHVYKKSVSAVKHAIKQAREKTSRMFPGIKATVKKRRGVALTEQETTSFEQFKKRAIGSGIVVACASGVTAGYYYDLLSIIFSNKDSDSQPIPKPLDLSGLPFLDPKILSSPPLPDQDGDHDILEEGTGQSSADPAAAVEEPQAKSSSPPPAPAPPPAPTFSAAPSPAGVVDPTSVTLRHVEEAAWRTVELSSLQKALTERSKSLTHIDPAKVKKPLTDEQNRLAALAASPMLQQQTRNARENGDDPSADEGAGKDSWNKDAREYDEVKKEKNGDPSDSHIAILNQVELDLEKSAQTIARSDAMLGQPQQTSGPESASIPCSAEEAANELERLLTEED